MNINGIDIDVLQVGYIRTNCYIVSKNKKCFIVDPGGQAGKIIGFIKNNDLQVEGIILTHGHFDHILAVEECRNEFRCDVYVAEPEKDLLAEPEMNRSVDFTSGVGVEADVLLRDNQVFELAGVNLKVIYTPGHTAGSAGYFLNDYEILFSGDTLFLESVGRTDLPTGNSMKIIESVTKRLFALEDDTIVLPGHGDKTKIGYEKRNNPYLYLDY